MGSLKTGIWWLAVMVALGCGTTQKGGKRGSTDSDGAAPDTKADASADAGTPHCRSTSCDANATCDDGSGVIKCSCKPGYEGDGATCTDVDECMTNNGGCGASATCKNLNGSFSCECDALSVKNGNQQCTDLCDMAKADSSVCGAGANARCTITKQGAVCTSCNPGFTGDGQSCVDHRADCPSACNGSSSSDPNSTCVSGAGKFTCTCADGYDGTPGSCKNIDECATGKASCNKGTTTCLDTEGGFYCACKDGYAGDAGNCKDIDECKDGKLYSCPKNASCINDPGSYHCGCASPFTGDDPKGCYCDLSGYWAMRQDLTTCWDERMLSGTVFIAPGLIQASIWELHKYSYDGSTLTSEKMGCGEDVTPDLQSPVFVETYSAYIPASVYAKVGFGKGRDVPIPNLVPGSMFTTPEEGSVSGIKLDGTAEAAAWPSARTDVSDPGPTATLPTWEDTDGDGELGLTLWSRWPTQETLASTSAMRLRYSYLPTHLMMTSGGTGTVVVDARAACVSTATRVITKLNVDVETCEKLSGDVINVKAEGRVRSCLPVKMSDWGNEIGCDMATWAATAHTATDCDPAPLDTQDQSQRSQATFDLIKIGSLTDKVDCAAVKKALPAIDRGTRATTCPF